jgi:hypothetical protein
MADLSEPIKHFLQEEMARLETENVRLRAAQADTPENYNALAMALNMGGSSVITVARNVLAALRARAGIDEEVDTEREADIACRSHGIGQESGAAETRASIVAWLRAMAAAYKLPNGPESLTAAAFDHAADAIERGDDLRKEAP